MRNEFDSLTNEVLFLVLNDCLTRAHDGAEGANMPYARGQLNKARRVLAELRFRVKEAEAIPA